VNGFQQTDKVPHGAMQMGMRQPGGPALGGQFAMGGQQPTLVPNSPGMQQQQFQQQAQISSPSMPKGAQPVPLSGSGPQLGNSAAAVPNRLASQGIQAPPQPFFRPTVLPGQQQQALPPQPQFQPQQQFQPQPAHQFQQPAPAPALGGPDQMEIRMIRVEGVAPNGTKLQADFEAEFPRGTKLLGAREVAAQ
jgi:hypothetical protein